MQTLLSGYVELAQPATTRDLRLLIDTASTDAEKTILQQLTDNYGTAVVAERLTIRRGALPGGSNRIRAV